MIMYPLDSNESATCGFEEYSREKKELAACGKRSVAASQGITLCLEHTRYAVGVADPITKTKKGGSNIPHAEFFRLIEQEDEKRQRREVRDARKV